jgi:hypothetical protein
MAAMAAPSRMPPTPPTTPAIINFFLDVASDVSGSDVIVSTVLGMNYKCKPVKIEVIVDRGEDVAVVEFGGGIGVGTVVRIPLFGRLVTELFWLYVMNSFDSS